jgi:hypothetical protein
MRWLGIFSSLRPRLLLASPCEESLEGDFVKVGGPHRLRERTPATPKGSKPRHGGSTPRPRSPAQQPLSNTSVNEILQLLSEIMQRAVDYGYPSQEPLKVGQHRHRFLPTPKAKTQGLEIFGPG